MSRFLIAEDDEQSRYFLAALLRGVGHEVDEAPNGVRALELARAHPPEMVISDALMPAMDGFVLCRELKKDERLRSIPFVFYTATYTEEADERYARSLGAADYLRKPLDPDELLAALDRILVACAGAPGGAAGEGPSEGDPDPALYASLLSRKLDRKLEQLQRTNGELQRELATRHELEVELQRINASLEKRVEERTAELKASNEELEAFSYSVSHDLRAPLRAIEGFAGMIEKDGGDHLTAEDRKRLGVVRANARKMSALIDDLLTFSRTGRQEIVRGRVMMKFLVRSALDEVAPDPEVRSRIDLRLEELPDADGDASLIRQIWVNLLSNALKFSAGRSRPEIGISGVSNGDVVTYTVRDNGVGFDPKHADRLFRVFQRLHSAADFEGTGIGLALVRRIVERHGGTVWAEGRPDEGATFHFSLPARKTSEPS